MSRRDADQTRELGPGYRVEMMRDDCGCTLRFAFVRFEHARITVDPFGEEFEYTDPESIGDDWTSHAKLPDGMEKQSLPTTLTSLHHLGKAELPEWLRTKITAHHARSFQDRDLDSDKAAQRDLHMRATARTREILEEITRQEEPRMSGPWRVVSAEEFVAMMAEGGPAALIRLFG